MSDAEVEDEVPPVGDAVDEEEEDDEMPQHEARQTTVEGGAPGDEDAADGEGGGDGEDAAARPRRLRKVIDAAEDSDGEEEGDGGDGDYKGASGSDDDGEYKPAGDEAKAKPRKKRAKKSGEEGEDGERKKKKRRKKGPEDEGGGGSRRRKKKGAAEDEGRRRPKRASALAAEEEMGVAGTQGGAAGAEGGEGEGEGEGDGEEGAPRPAYDDPDEDSVDAPEAEVETAAASAFDAMLEGMKRKKKVEKAQDEVIADVERFLTRMDDAAVADQASHRQGKPAVLKVAMMREMELMFKKEFLHEFLLDKGALHSCNKWLQPLPDGTLPNESVRAAVFRALAQFDCDEIFKERLRSSGVGKYIMMYSKHSDESVENKRRCNELKEKWMRPVYKKTLDYAHASVARRAKPRMPGAASRLDAVPGSRDREGDGGDGDVLEASRNAPKPGEAGFMYRAAIPQAESMDFRLMPQSTAMPKPSQKYDKESTKGKLSGKVLALKRKGGKRTQAESISIEGRNL